MKEIMTLDGIVVSSKIATTYDNTLIATAEIKAVGGTSAFEQSAADPVASSGVRLHFKSDIKPGTRLVFVIYEVDDERN